MEKVFIVKQSGKYLIHLEKDGVMLAIIHTYFFPYSQFLFEMEGQLLPSGVVADATPMICSKGAAC